MEQGYLEIRSLDQLSEALIRIKADQTLASRIRTVSIDETDDQPKEDEDAPRRSQLSGDEIAAQAAEEQMKAIGQTARRSAGVTTLLEAIAEDGHLESVKWSLDSWNSKNCVRGKSLWDALARNAGTLKRLDLDFYTHEIHNLAEEGINPVPSPFPELQHLTLRMSGGHGDNAKAFDVMLRDLPKLKSLRLYLPSCDLESCRIQSLTYNWNLPSLIEFGIQAYVSDDSGFPAFLSRHPSIQTLKYDVESETPIRIAPTDLPNLRALSIESFAQDDDLAQSDLIASSRPIKHLRVGKAPYHRYPKLAVVGESSLHCLEIHGSWAEEQVQKSMKELLPKFTNLREFGVDIQSEDRTYWQDGQWHYPEPLNVTNLVRLLIETLLDRNVELTNALDQYTGFVPTRQYSPCFAHDR